jgi:hypothetical protein
MNPRLKKKQRPKRQLNTCIQPSTIQRRDASSAPLFMCDPLFEQNVLKLQCAVRCFDNDNAKHWELPLHTGVKPHGHAVGIDHFTLDITKDIASLNSTKAGDKVFTRLAKKSLECVATSLSPRFIEPTLALGKELIPNEVVLLIY